MTNLVTDLQLWLMIGVPLLFNVAGFAVVFASVKARFDRFDRSLNEVDRKPKRLVEN